MSKKSIDIQRQMGYHRELQKQNRRKFMSEVQSQATPTEMPARTLETVKKEYVNQCSIIGDRKYRIAVMEAEVNAALNKINELNDEANKLEKEAANGTAS